MRLFSFLWIIVALFSFSVSAADREKKGEPKVKTPQAVVSSYNADYDFKGVRLGMTVSEFKALPYPKEAKPYDHPQTTPGLRQTVSSVAPECTGDLNAESGIAFAKDRDLGVVECAWVVLQKSYTEIKFISALSVGDLMAKSYKFRFIAMPGESEPRLFRIELITHARGFSNLATLLSEKFGQPTEITKSTAQNRMGATFDNDTVVWRNRTGEVALYQLLGDVDTGLLLYSLKSHAQFYDSLVKEKKAKEGSKI